MLEWRKNYSLARASEGGAGEGWSAMEKNPETLK